MMYSTWFLSSLLIPIVLTAAGTNLEVAQCPETTVSKSCAAAYLAMHLTAKSTAYLEVGLIFLIKLSAI